MIERITGRDMRITVFRDGVPVDVLEPATMDVELDLDTGTYLGEVGVDFDSMFKGAKLELQGETTGRTTEFWTGLAAAARRAGPKPSWLADIARVLSVKVERTRSGFWLVKGGGRPTCRYRTKALAERAAKPRQEIRVEFRGALPSTIKEIVFKFDMEGAEVR